MSPVMENGFVPRVFSLFHIKLYISLKILLEHICSIPLTFDGITCTNMTNHNLQIKFPLVKYIQVLNVIIDYPSDEFSVHRPSDDLFVVLN